MKKNITILLIIILTAFLVVGCTKSAETTNTPPTQNKAVNTQATPEISDASNTSNTLDIAQIDTQLDSVNKSLAEW